MTLCPVILAGGEGARLWPLSRRDFPKQFTRLLGDHALLQETLLRFQKIAPGVDVAPPLIICNQAHRFIALEQAREINAVIKPIILEPVGRNTAPALTVASLALSEQEADPVLIMLPADHLIEDRDGFQRAVEAGFELAKQGFIVTFGMQASAAETGYGYIQKGQVLSAADAVFKLAGFTEKPDIALAQEYISNGGYLYNSGIFMMQASTWITAIKSLHGAIYEACEAAYKKGRLDDDFFRLDEQAFADCPSDSIDYAVMEKIAGIEHIPAVVVSADVGWSDIGDWNKVWERSATDEHNNACTGDVVTVATANSLIFSESRLVATVGCESIAVIETADAVMVLNKDRAQDVKMLVNRLAEQGRDELEQHQYVRRPWGGYATIETGAGYQVKRLSIHPGRRISLQLHHQRSEHWVVIKGRATVTKDDAVFELGVNGSTFIPLGMKHRLENRAASVLEIIEVQVGAYVGEDDIVRFEDDFGRH